MTLRTEGELHDTIAVMSLVLPALETEFIRPLQEIGEDACAMGISLRSLYRRFFGRCAVCGDKNRRQEVSLVFRGATIGRKKTCRLCAACSLEYLERNSTTCGECGGPIIPGEPVGVAATDAPHPYRHLTEKCSPTAGLYCGTWGNGELIPFETEGQV